MIYLTFNDNISGIYKSQVVDVLFALNKIHNHSIIDENAVVNTDYISLYLLSSPIKFSAHARKGNLEREVWEKYFAL